MKRKLLNNASVVRRAFVLGLCLVLLSLVPGHAQNSSGNQMELLGLSTADSAKPVAAFALRQLTASYTGPLVRIRLSSNGNFYDVYPDATVNKAFSLTSTVSANGAIAAYNGAVSPATATTLGALVTGIDATVVIWYDQSGTANNNAYQATAGNQPKIVSLGNLITMGANNRPAISFNSASGNTLITTGYNISQLNGKCTYSFNTVATSNTSNAATARLVSMKSSIESNDLSYAAAGQVANGSALAVYGTNIYGSKQQYTSGAFPATFKYYPVFVVTLFWRTGKFGM